MTTVELNAPSHEVTSSNVDAGFIRRLLRRWRERRAERATLMELSRIEPYLLRDMGIEPSDIFDALDGKRSSLLFIPMRQPDHR